MLNDVIKRALTMDSGLGSNHNLTSTLEKAFGMARLTSDIRKALKLSAPRVCCHCYYQDQTWKKVWSWDPRSWGTFWVFHVYFKGEFWIIVFRYLSFEIVKCFSYHDNRIWSLFCFRTAFQTNIIEFQTLRMFLSWNIILWG